MGSYLTLPIDVALAAAGGRFKFTTTIGERSYTFEFWYNPAGDHWNLQIREPIQGERVFNQKIVYGDAYTIDEYFVLAFYDPQRIEMKVNRVNLGSSVIAGVGLLGDEE